MTAGIRIALGSLLLAAPWALSHAQEFPTRPVKIIVGFPAGGTADAMPRIVAAWLPSPVRVRRWRSCRKAGPSRLTPTWMRLRAKQSHQASLITMALVCTDWRISSGGPAQRSWARRMCSPASS